MRVSVATIRQQRGAAVIIMLLILIVGGAYFLVSELTRARGNIDRDKRTTEALASAKEALIGYAVTYYEDHPGEFGFMPCPDNVAGGAILEGGEDGSCGVQYTNAIGRLPWRTLGLQDVRDGNGECLWYAVSGTYKNGTAKPGMLNDDSNGMFRVYDSSDVLLAGATPESRAVAIIIAPGAPIPGQDRTSAGSGTEICGGNYAPGAYLEVRNGRDNSNVAATADTVDDFVTATDRTTAALTPPFNDRVIYITQGDIWDAVKLRSDFSQRMTDLTGLVRTCMENYGASNSNKLPWSAPLDLVEYRDGAQYVSSASNAYGRVPDVVGATNIITACNATTWAATPEFPVLWAHWKDHLFYAVAPGYRPDASISAPFTVNSSGSYAAVVLFANARLSGQLRRIAPDSETKNSVSNYLEPDNSTRFSSASGSDFTSATSSNTFNDVVTPIGTSMTCGGMGGMGGGMGGMGCGGGMGGGMGGGGGM